ncbi:Endoprotease [Yamadazyma tenuis]|uniref:Endoprotease n=1 Tax=Candida tenuis TaxID=2315449 RepID=UPI00279A508C|nr:Endoprotease [Yamadazyma tenuis]
METTAISISVNSGSNNDGDIKGLAHLVEHMLFSGTKEFRQPYFLIDNISKAGGTINAFTSYNQTNYHLEASNTSKSIRNINPQVKSDDGVVGYLIHMFSRFFKNPVFNNQCIKNEIKDINEEHLANLNSESKRFYHCLKLLVSETHSFHSFATGNTNTLSSIPKLRKHLVNYFERYYYASNIKIVIKSSLSLNQLQKLAVMNFNDIPDKPISPQLALPFFQTYEKGNLLQVETTKQPKMRVVFPINQLNDSLIQISKVWIELLGQEEPGSLCFHLLKQNFATEVNVFDQLVDFNNLMIFIEIHLTTNGYNNIKTIMRYISAYIKLILRSPVKRIGKVIDQCLRLEKFEFIYQDNDDSSMDEVSCLSERLHYLHPSDVLVGYKLQSNLPTSLFLIETKRWLNIRSSNLIVFGPSTIDSRPMKCQLSDEYYTLNYCVCRLDSKSVDYDSVPEFKLPERNKFLIWSHEELDSMLHQFHEFQGNMNMNVKFKIDQPPFLAEHSQNLELWFKKEFTFNSKCFVSFQLCSKSLEHNCRHLVAVDLLCEALGVALASSLYHSEKLGFSWSIYPSLNGTNSITITLIGINMLFKEILQELIGIVVDELRNLQSLPYSLFMRYRVGLRKRYKKLYEEEYLVQSMAAGMFVMETNVFSIEEKCETLEEIVLEEVVAISLSLINDSYTSIFLNGDGTVDDCYDISHIINRLSNHLSLDTTRKVNDPSSFQPIIGKFRFEIPAATANDFCYFYIHLGERNNSYIRTISKLLEYVTGRNIHKLKSERNLGYRIVSGLKIFRKTMGLFLYVESNEYSYKMLSRNIEDYLHVIESEIESLNNEQFREQMLNPCLNSLEFHNETQFSPDTVFDLLPCKASTNFENDSKSYFIHKSTWVQILNRNYRFNAKNGNEEVDVDLLRRVTRVELLKMFTLLVSPDSESRSIITITNDENSQRLSQKINDYIDSRSLSITSEAKSNLLKINEFDIIKEVLEKRFTQKNGMNIKGFLKPIGNDSQYLYPSKQKERTMGVSRYHHTTDIIKDQQDHLERLEVYISGQ